MKRPFYALPASRYRAFCPWQRFFCVYLKNCFPSNAKRIVWVLWLKSAPVSTHYTSILDLLFACNWRIGIYNVVEFPSPFQWVALSVCRSLSQLFASKALESSHPNPPAKHHLRDHYFLMLTHLYCVIPLMLHTCLIDFINTATALTELFRSHSSCKHLKT